MKRRMEQLINGRFEYEVPGLVFSQKEISLETKAGENCRGEFIIGSEDNRRIKGMVMSSDRRVVLGREKFSGNAVTIPYVADVKGLAAGDVIKAQITVNSSLGEYQIPVRVQVTAEEIRTSRGTVRTLDEFVRLAAEDYREAFRLYTSDAFSQILYGPDSRFDSLYRGMSRNPVTYQHMEEFLIGTGKKEPVHIHLDRDRKDMPRVESTLKDSLEIIRDGGGYIRIDVEVQGDFLEVEKRVLTSEDFIGSVCSLEFLVQKSRLGKGKKCGRILLKTVYETVSFEVTASRGSEYELNTWKLEQKAKARMALLYEAYLLEQITREQWCGQTMEELQALKDAGCFFMPHQLYEAFVWYCCENTAKCIAGLWPLRETKFEPEQMEEEGVYLALSSLAGILPPDQQEAGADRVGTLYRMKPNSRILLKCLFAVDGEYKNSPAKRLYMMEELFSLGCTSPFLYLDACREMEKDENQLKKLSPFMVQALGFAAKHGLLTEGLTLRIGHLSEYVKNFSGAVYRLLVSCYEQFPRKDLVDDICKYIMKGQPGKREYFRWYALAVENDIRITRLYEYYIETMPEGYQQVLPQVIRMYFVYNNTLSSRKRAMVYANVIRNRNQDKGTYHSYRKAMEEFAAESLKKGKISEDYAVIYQDCIGKLPDAQTGEAMARVMFTHRLYCDDRKIRKVIVCHRELAGEEEYPCVDGAAYINLYAPDARILFEDDKRRRYASTVDYNLQKLMDEDAYVPQCMALDVIHPGFLLHVCQGDQPVSVRTLSCCQRIVEMKEFREEYRHRICRKILEYYADHAGDDTLDGYLRQIDAMAFAKVDKVLLTELLIDRGMYETAFSIICQYGYEGIRTDRLVKLASRMVLRTEFVENEELVYLCFHVFEQGKYDDVILSYLSDNLLGPVEEMAVLWERMKGFQLDTYALEEEILLLAMFGRVWLPQGHRILRSYVQQKGKQQVILAYLSYQAYDYFLGGRETDSFIFECIQICCVRDWEMDIICRLALLKYYSGLSEWTQEQEKLIGELLAACSEMGLRFAFFGRLPEIFTKAYQLDDKLFVEEKLPAKARVTIHYRISGHGREGQWKSEPMRNMFQGIFVKEFLLFYGEKVRYRLTVEEGDSSRDTEEKWLSMEEYSRDGGSKYQLLNQMLAGWTLSQNAMLEDGVKKYLTRERLAETMFPLIQ